MVLDASGSSISRDFHGFTVEGKLFGLNSSGIANAADQRDRKFIDESFCTSTAIPITELSCGIPLATFHERRKKKKERSMSSKRLQTRCRILRRYKRLYARDFPVYALKYLLKRIFIAVRCLLCMVVWIERGIKFLAVILTRIPCFAKTLLGCKFYSR